MSQAMDIDSVLPHHKTARPVAPYVTRPPSPPPVVIPAAPMSGWATPMKIVPSYDSIDPTSMSYKDLAIITRNGREQVAHDSAVNWTYESRRIAQPILDFLYLGPSTVVRNRQWLREQGITMLLAARDTRQAGLNFMVVDNVAQELGIEVKYVDVSGYHELIRAFPSAVRMINEHMVRIYHEQAVNDAANLDVQDGAMVINETNFRRGKVLVFCETGNDRSAGIVTAYLMAILGMNLVQACQFINYKRFCVSMEEDLKHTLKAYEDILLAQRTVHQHELASKLNPLPKKAKRGIDETTESEGDTGMTGMNGPPPSDRARYIDRGVFVPFIDN
ncbi:phosphatases II [Xylariaceae sp. FL1651]|nr:phosphatases II [Xylariaceae sp. FL1651]